MEVIASRMRVLLNFHCTTSFHANCMHITCFENGACSDGFTEADSNQPLFLPAVNSRHTLFRALTCTHILPTFLFRRSRLPSPSGTCRPRSCCASSSSLCQASSAGSPSARLSASSGRHGSRTQPSGRISSSRGLRAGRLFPMSLCSRLPGEPLGSSAASTSRPPPVNASPCGTATDPCSP